MCRVAAWWTANIEGSTVNAGDTFTVYFAETFVTFRVIEMGEYKKTAWHITDCNLHWLNDKKEWQDTVINWQVSTENNITSINFMHIGLVPAIECYNDCSKGWNFHISESLCKLNTMGKGLPEKKAAQSLAVD